MPPFNALLHAHRFHRHWRWLLLVLAGITAYFAFTPGGVPGPDFDGADKIHHLLAFGSMAVAGALSVSQGGRWAAQVAAALLAYGGFIELVQSQLPTRTASWADLLADAFGIAGGLVLTALLRRSWPAAG